jgi:hypothetical protein
LRASLALLIVSTAACAGLSPAAQRIQISSKSDTATCRFIKVVYGGPGFTAQNDALENAASAHATHIVTLYDQDQKFTADAYDCDHKNDPAPVNHPPSPVAQAAPGAPPTSVPQPTIEEKAHGGWVIAVMEVENRAGPSDGVSRMLLQNIGDQLRIFIAEKGLRTIDRGQQETLIHHQIAEQKKESYQSCYDNSCQIELGKALAASHILRSQVARFGQSCVLNAELIDLKAEVTIAATSSRGSCEEEGFLAMSEKVASGLVQH